MEIKISPSILSADFSKLGEEIQKVEEAGAHWLHIDVMDGHFVPNITIGPLILESIKGKTNLIKDVHLMIENPDRYIGDFIKAGADIITVHQEACVHLHRTIQLIKSYGIKAGVAINPATPIAVVEDIITDLDMVLIMSVNPGFGGQKFIKGSLDKIRKVKELSKNKGIEIDIQVDGGINLNNINEVASAGANVIVAGSAIFNSSDIQYTIAEMKRICGNI
jgi:ribulose-phosphate 3-epimerase